MGLPPNALPSGGSSGVSPRGAPLSNGHYGGGGAGSSGAGYGTGGGLGAGNSLYLSNQPQASSSLQQQQQQQQMMMQQVGQRKHRASSRQSSKARRGQNRYAESPNYNPPHGGGVGADGSVGAGGIPNSNGRHPQQGGGLGHTLGPGASPSYLLQQHAPSPSSTMMLGGGGQDGGHHQQQAYAQQQHGGGVLPHIGGVSGNAGGFSTGPLQSGGQQLQQPPSGSKHSNSTNPRSQFLSQMNAPSSPNMGQPAGPGGTGGLSNGSAPPPFTVASAPVVREFQSGNVLTGTEEHGHSAVTTIRGMKPGNPNWINQDNFFVTENFEGRDVRIYCVLDGHGEHGHLVSRRAREMFPQFIKSARMDIDAAFNMMQNDLNSASDMDVRCSGATCVMATLYNGRLAVYNCGDSRAVLGRRNPNGSIYAVALSKDHKPDKPEERKRILSCGGHLGCRQVLVNQPGRGPVSMPVGPCRVWYQHRGETLGLAMSRSLGDSIVHKSGVSAEPECIDRTIDDFDEFFILATDGVWDVVDNNYAVQLVQSFAAKSANWSPLEAASSICRFARSRWEKLSPMIDDITCIVVKVHR
jgi:serine/threonine protein phosphatase PrpC